MSALSIPFQTFTVPVIYRNLFLGLPTRIGCKVSDNYITHAVLILNVHLFREHERSDDTVDKPRYITVL